MKPRKRIRMHSSGKPAVDITIEADERVLKVLAETKSKLAIQGTVNLGLPFPFPRSIPINVVVKVTDADNEV